MPNRLAVTVNFKGGFCEAFNRSGILLCCLWLQ